MFELGRYKGIPSSERLCTKCKKVEDEVHFLLGCTHLDLMREVFFKKANIRLNHNLPLHVNFLKIMESKSPQLTFYLGRFITKAFKEKSIDVNFLPKFF